MHFGLGEAETIESLQIQWPSGIIDEYADLDVNQIYALIEGNSPLSTDPTGSLEISLYPNPSYDGMLNVAINLNEPL